MIRFFLLCLSLLFLQIPLSPPVFAQGKGIIISPKRIVFEKGQRIAEVLLANRGDSPEKYRIALVNRDMQENGQLKESENPAQGEYFASDVLRYSPRQVILEPKSTQKIRIMSRLKANASEGEYRSHLLVQEIPKPEKAQKAGEQADRKLGINVQAVFGVTIPVILRKGDLSAEISLSAPKIEKIGEDTYLTIAINRSGTKSVLGTLNAFTDSQKIGILKNIAVYLSTPRRVISVKLDPKHAKKISGKNIRVTFGAEEENEDAPATALTFTAP